MNGNANAFGFTGVNEVTCVGAAVVAANLSAMGVLGSHVTAGEAGGSEDVEAGEHGPALYDGVDPVRGEDMVSCGTAGPISFSYMFSNPEIVDGLVVLEVDGPSAPKLLVADDVEAGNWADDTGEATCAVISATIGAEPVEVVGACSARRGAE